ncbi:MAG: hypothetical protein M2R45_03884 [Verrucomicrobia subdivision 3 bacterium]|nr:hypothetical protein [Limisphaerales bacterium]
MGIFIISPNDEGGKLYEPSPQVGQFIRTVITHGV